MIIFAYLPYGLAEGIKLSGRFALSQPFSCVTHENFFSCFLIINRNHVDPLCGNCDVPLHPPQLVTCHSDSNAADTAHCGLHVWSVIFFCKVFVKYLYNCIYFSCFCSTSLVNFLVHFFLQKRVCLPSSASPSSASPTTLRYHLLFGAS